MFNRTIKTLTSFKDWFLGKEEEYDFDLPEGVKRVELLEKSFEEAWTPKSYADHNKEYIQVNMQGLNFDLFGTWENLRAQYHFRGPVRNVVNNYSMLIGSPDITFGGAADTNRWNDIAMVNRFPLRWEEIKQNTLLFGDYFTIKLDKTIHGTTAGIPKIRNLIPTKITEVVHEAGDPESVEKYRKGAPAEGESKYYDAENVVHHTLGRIGNLTRGIPILSACLRELDYYYKGMKDFYFLNHMRARIPLVRKVKGGLSNVTAEAIRWGKLPGYGRVAIENESAEWQFPPAYGGSSEGIKGVELYLLGIALAVQLPYFLVASDYRNNSLASTLSADSPTTRMVGMYRQYLEAQYKDVVRMAMDNPTLEMEIKWPSVVERDKKKEAEAYAIGRGQGAVSSKDMCTDVYGKKWEETKAQIDAEDKEQENKFGLPNLNAPAIPPQNKKPDDQEEENDDK